MGLHCKQPRGGQLPRSNLGGTVAGKQTRAPVVSQAAFRYSQTEARHETANAVSQRRQRRSDAQRRSGACSMQERKPLIVSETRPICLYYSTRSSLALHRKLL